MDRNLKNSYKSTCQIVFMPSLFCQGFYWHFQQGSNLFSQAGKTIWTELLHKKNYFANGQTKWSGLTWNLCIFPFNFACSFLSPIESHLKLDPKFLWKLCSSTGISRGWVVLKPKNLLWDIGVGGCEGGLRGEWYRHFLGCHRMLHCAVM